MKKTLLVLLLCTVTPIYAAKPVQKGKPKPPPVSSFAGTTTSITCPVGSVNVSATQSLQAAVDSHAGVTTFCLLAGVHQVSFSVIPKSGNRFIGQYGAILDGTGWSTSAGDAAALQASNSDINDVTIQNIVFRNMPQKAVYANNSFGHDFADRWVIDHCEITATDRAIQVPSLSTVSNNYIHHNRTSGYSGNQIHDSVFDHNEFSYNGRESKVLSSTNVHFRNNWVHHNANGIWYDTSNQGQVIENNTVEDNAENAINIEISFDSLVRNNTIRRNGEAGIFVATSQRVEAYGNVLENNLHGLQFFLEFLAIPDGFDLKDNIFHDNSVTVGSGQAGAWLSHGSAGDLTPYLNGSKNLQFVNNTYFVPNSTGNWWYWEGYKTWSQWVAIPQQ